MAFTLVYVFISLKIAIASKRTISVEKNAGQSSVWQIQQCCLVSVVNTGKAKGSSELVSSYLLIHRYLKLLI